MATRGDIVEFARTLIRGDFEANDRYERALDEDGWDGWPSFLSALFFLAVDRRFKGTYDEAQVIRFVADLRAEAGEGALPIDPSSMELLIKAVLDPAVRFDLPAETMGQIQTMVAYTILAREGLSDKELDGVLAEAQSIAEGQSGAA